MNNEKLPYSWISSIRPTKRNLKNIKDNNNVLNIVQKEYMNVGNASFNNNIKNEKEVIRKNDIKDNGLNEE